MALFDETAQGKIMAFFFSKPEREAYVREIAREAPVNEGSASTLCRKLDREDILRATKKGNALFYALRNESPLVKKLKVAWFLEKLLAYRKDWENDELHSIALYGSYASGDFISKSDVDLLVISNAGRETLNAAFSKLKERIEPEVSLTHFTLSGWMKLARKKDRFYIEVLSNHLLLHGEPLVVG